jgi:putative membrane protein
MTTDAWLAIAHHAAVFGLLGALAAEFGLLRPGLVAADIRRLVNLDRAYGVFAVAVLAAGFTRVEFGAQPWAFYTENPFFWLKLGTFAVIGLLSAYPTVQYIRWSRAGGEAPPAAALGRVRSAVSAQLLLFPVLPICAALMARGIGA